jgi:hypothetical protein
MPDPERLSGERGRLDRTRRRLAGRILPLTGFAIRVSWQPYR